MSLNFIPDNDFLAKRCICPDCSSAISIIALMRSLKANKIECSVCGTEVYVKRFWLYWLLDKMFVGIFFCIIVALGMVLVVLYVGIFIVLAKNKFLLIAVFAIISMALLVEAKDMAKWIAAFAITSMALLVKAKDMAKDITKQRAMQFFSARKYAGFRTEFTILFGVVTVSLVWILANGIFLIDYAQVTGSMPMKEETYEAIISSGRRLSSIESFFFIQILVVVPGSLLYFLYIIAFQKNAKKGVCYRMLFVFYSACWMVILPAKIGSMVSFYINKSFVAEIDQRTQPLFVSIESFTNDYGRPPDSLQELVPDYMDSSSVMIFEKYPYDYRVVSVDEQNFGALYVPVYCGDSTHIKECKIVRLSGQNYSHSNMVESVLHPNRTWHYGRRLNDGLVLQLGMHAFSNKKQNWSYYIWFLAPHDLIGHYFGP